MANDTLNFFINIQGSSVGVVSQLNTQFNQLNENAEKTKGLFSQIGDVARDFVFIYRLKQVSNPG